MYAYVLHCVANIAFGFCSTPTLSIDDQRGVLCIFGLYIPKLMSEELHYECQGVGAAVQATAQLWWFLHTSR